VRGIAAKRHLAHARAAVPALQASLVAGGPDVPARLAALQRETRAARRLTSDPVWRVAARVPYAGRTLRTAGGLAAAADDLARTTLPDVDAASRALSVKALRTSGDTVALAPLVAAGPRLVRVRDSVARSEARVRALPSAFVLGPVGDARDEFLDQLASLRGTTASAALAASVAPDLLGAQGIRRYFVAFLNNAEMRGSGGLLGAYGVLEVTHGRFRLRELGTNATLRNTASPAVAMDAEFVARYRRFQADSYWVNANMSPHFPAASRIWTALWARMHAGERLDGTLALDPVALSAILRVTGPAVLADGTAVTADNVVPLTERDAYQRFAADNAARDAYLQGVAKASYRRITSGSGDTVALVRALARMAGERHLQVASEHAAEAAALAPTPLAGVLPVGGPYLNVVTQNAGGNKLDYYLRRTVTYAPGRIEVRLRNTAPPGLPAYVTNRLDRPGLTAAVKGQQRLYLSVYTSENTGLFGATIDGKPAGLESERERGHPVFSAFLDVDPGSEVVVVLRVSERVAPPRVVRQPVVVPDVLVGLRP
jgi:hypothetical protein